jgi:hypothetical protein
MTLGLPRGANACYFRLPDTDVQNQDCDMAKLKKLKLSLKTSPEPFAGTDAHVYLGLCAAGAGQWYRVPARPGDLESGSLNIYETELAEAPETSQITGLVLVNGMNGGNPGWRVLWVRVEAVDANGRAWLLADAMLQRWLDTKEDAAPAAFVPLQQPFGDLGTEDNIGNPGVAFQPIA